MDISQPSGNLLTRLAAASWFRVIAASCIIVALALRCIGIDKRWLWGDELWTVSVAKDGLWTALLATARFDLHPPLYYMQLSIWMLPGHGDQWMMLNSIAWNVAAVALLILTVASRYGIRAGLGAGAMLAVSPAALEYTDDVRMYSMLLVLIICAWYAQARWFDGRQGVRGAVYMILSQCAVAYTHGAALVMLSGCVLLGAVTALRRKDFILFRNWLAIEAVVGVLVVPTVIIALFRGAAHPIVPDFSNVLRTWTFLITGHSSLDTGFVVLALIVFGILVIAGMRRPEMGLETATLVFAPLILADVASHLFKPIWLDRTFYPTIPFICLGLARATLTGEQAARPFNQLAPGVFGLLLLTWFAVGATDQFNRPKGDGFKRAAEIVRDSQRPGDVIAIGPNYSYWYFMWYYGGPGWGKPLHAFILNSDWARLLARLPRQIVAIFGMSEADRSLSYDGATVMLWDPDRPLPAARDIILVGDQTFRNIGFPNYRLESTTTEQQVLIQHFVPVTEAR